ncbi:TPR domain protein [Xylariaceae sp. FL1019]|nr:TPR domain protein [Xylariaceae sp. FL1019]
MDPEAIELQLMLSVTAAASEHIRRRQGHIPTLPPRQDVIDIFLCHRTNETIMSRSKDLHNITVTQLFPPYSPSILPIADLEPMPLSRMRLFERHRGKKVTVRVITSPFVMNMDTISAVVEDEEGSVVRLDLCHQLEPPLISAEDILCPATVLMLKEPYFMVDMDHQYCLQVDHVTDVIWLQASDEQVPQKWHSLFPKPGNSASIRAEGNAAVKQGQWGKAAHLYTQAIRAAETPEEKQQACLNRSLAYLRLGFPERSLEDAVAGFGNAQQSEKGSFRQARALYELGRFEECLAMWSASTKMFPQIEEAHTELRKTEQRIKEQLTGEYDFASMCQQALTASTPIIDCATYQGPVAVKDIDGCGKGLFLTKAVGAGELLLCEKAFGYSYADKHDLIGRRHLSIFMQIESKRVTWDGQAHLVTQIVQKLKNCPQLSEAFKTLYHEDYPTGSVSEIDGQPVVDTFLVEKIVSLNHFPAPRTNHGPSTFCPHECCKTRGSCGIWLVASRINHSCLENCHRSFIGDVQIVRATKDLPAGTELRFAYRPCAPRVTYEETQEHLSTWGFTCDCQWCTDRNSTPNQKLQARKRLLRILDVALDGFLKAQDGEPPLPHRITRLIGQVSKTYLAREGGVRLELADVLFAVGAVLGSAHPLDAIKYIIKAFEALGYGIVTTPAQQGGAPNMVIKRWGHVVEVTVAGLACLHTAYKAVAPEMCPKVREYALTLYIICTGTGEGFSEVFAGFA